MELAVIDLLLKLFLLIEVKFKRKYVLIALINFILFTMQS